MYSQENTLQPSNVILYAPRLEDPSLTSGLHVRVMISELILRDLCPTGSDLLMHDSGIGKQSILFPTTHQPDNARETYGLSLVLSAELISIVPV